MKKHLSFILMILFFATLYGCGEKLSGRSEKDYELSRKKVEAKLSKDEKVTLEKALRVIAGESMRLKFVEPQKYKNQSFGNIALKIVDGCTYSSVVNKAEDILQASNKRDVEALSHEIDSLGRKKATDLSIRKSMLSLFKLDNINITKVNFFNDSVPSLHLSYTYIGKHPLKGEWGISYEIYQKGNPAPVIGSTSILGDSASILQSGEAIDENLILRAISEKDPQKWDAMKYPLHNPDLKSLGLRLDVHPVSFTLNGKHYAFPKSDDAALASEIKEKTVELNDIKKLKGTLDELELTNNK